MCGILGWTGRGPATDILLNGLTRLEYRGYDSTGIALVEPGGGLEIHRAAGPLCHLTALLRGRSRSASTTGIGHTRWATHGGPSDRNAHPHVDATGSVAVVHNGIVENAPALRAELEADGIQLASDTDTEVTAHLVARVMHAEPGTCLAEAVRRVTTRLQGAFGLVFAHGDDPHRLVAVRRSSPLVVGLSPDATLVSSDVSAVADRVSEAAQPGDDEIVTLTADGFSVTDLAGRPIQCPTFQVEPDRYPADKNGHDSFMSKEISEQPGALSDALSHYTTHDGVDEQLLPIKPLRDITSILVLACGTSLHAGMAAAYAIERWCRLPVRVELASEFRYRDPVIESGTLIVAISQSGETADTLEAMRHARARGAAMTVSICNVAGSQIPRESDTVLYTRAGPEIGVAATKTFSTQVAICHLLGLAVARAQESLDPGQLAWHASELTGAPDAVAKALTATAGPVADAVPELAARDTVLFLGRDAAYPIALEGALKLKELAYMHAEGFAAGELKHGPLALIEPGTPVVVLMPSPRNTILHTKILSNVREIQARGAHTVMVADEDDADAARLAHWWWGTPAVPDIVRPITSIVALQLLAHGVAQARGHDVDRPRNIAKSVTVE